MSARFTPLAVNVRQAALAIGLSGSLLGSAWAAPVSYSIPAGSLATAINAFAKASGVVVSFSSEDSAGLHSEGLQGSFEPEQGLAQLLQGTGLQAQQAAENHYLLARPSSGAALELGATTVSSVQPLPGCGSRRVKPRSRSAW